MRHEFHRSAFRHGCEEGEILHAVDHSLVLVELEPDADPPKVLAIGPGLAGNLLEVIWLELEGEVVLVIHAMALRSLFYDLLPTGEDENL